MVEFMLEFRLSVSDASIRRERRFRSPYPFERRKRSER